MKNENKKKINIKDPRVIALAAALVILIVLGTLSVLAASYDKIYSGVTVGGVELGGKTVEEAYAALTENFGEVLPEISVSAGENNADIIFTDIAEYDFMKTAEAAYEKGRGNIFNSFFAYITPFVERKVPISTTINRDVLEERLDTLQQSIDGGYKKSETEISGNELIVRTGHSGKAIDITKLFEDITKLLEQHEDVKVEAVITDKEFEAPDVDKIYDKIHTEAQDAYFDKENNKIAGHVDGYDFDKKSAKAILSAAKPDSEYRIPLTVIGAAKTTEQLEAELFSDQLGTYTTKYNAGNTNRSHNVALAASKFNGYIMMPGDVFSYNGVVGDRTVAAGYRNAAVYTSNGVEDGIGGGICQVSSTLYNAVLYSNLEIVSRRNHSYPVSYAPKGQDATVSMGAIDFLFKNNSENPIQIRTYVGGGNCTVSIYGKKTVPFTVSVESTIVSTKPYTVEYTDDPNMPEGEEKITREGITGYGVRTVRYVTINGVTTKEQLPNSNYVALSQKVTRGTMKVEEPIPEDGTVVDPNAPQVPSVPEVPVTPDAPVTPDVPTVTPEVPSVVTPDVPAVQPDIIDWAG